MSETYEQFAALVKALIEEVREHGRVFESTMAVIAAHSDLAAENGRLADRVRAREVEYQRAIEELNFARQVLVETQEELRRLRIELANSERRATDEQFAALVEDLMEAVREHTLRPKDRYYDPAPERAAVIAAHSGLAAENARLTARLAEQEEGLALAQSWGEEMDRQALKFQQEDGSLRSRLAEAEQSADLSARIAANEVEARERAEQRVRDLEAALEYLRRQAQFVRDGAGESAPFERLFWCDEKAAIALRGT